MDVSLRLAHAIKIVKKIFKKMTTQGHHSYSWTWSSNSSRLRVVTVLCFPSSTIPTLERYDVCFSDRFLLLCRVHGCNGTAPCGLALRTSEAFPGEAFPIGTGFLSCDNGCAMCCRYVEFTSAYILF